LIEVQVAGIALREQPPRLAGILRLPCQARGCKERVGSLEFTAQPLTLKVVIRATCERAPNDDRRVYQRIRLLNSLDQLMETQDLASLALHLGFASHSHFSTAFVREFGITPSEFRRIATSRDLKIVSKILKV
jgi:AraC-like DNA-binding protein